MRGDSHADDKGNNFFEGKGCMGGVRSMASAKAILLVSSPYNVTFTREERANTKNSNKSDSSTEMGKKWESGTERSRKKPCCTLTFYEGSSVRNETSCITSGLLSPET